MRKKGYGLWVMGYGSPSLPFTIDKSFKARFRRHCGIFWRVGNLIMKHPSSLPKNIRNPLAKALPLLFLFLNSFSVFAQPTVKVTTDKNRYIVGDRIDVKITVQKPEGYFISWPQFPPNYGRFEPMDSMIEDSAPNGSLYHRTIPVSAYDSGKFTFPALPIFYRHKGDTTQKILFTDSFQITVLRVGVDTSKAFMPIKAPEKLAYTWQELLPYIIGGALLLAILITLIVMYIKKKKKEALLGKPLLPPYEEAMEELHKLKKQQLWEQGEIKHYYIRLSDIVRRYIERRFGIEAMESTTNEIIRALRKTDTEELARMKLKELLELSDLVKFARLTTIADDNLNSYVMAIDFVEMTRPAILPNEPEKKA